MGRSAARRGLRGPVWLVCLAIAALALACSSSAEPEEESPLKDVQVSGGPGKEPTVSTESGFGVDQTVSKVLQRGDGPTVAIGDTVSLNYIGVDGSTGKTFDSSYENGTPLTTTLDEEALIPGLVEGIEGKRVGSRTLVAVPPEEGYGERGNPQAGIDGGDTLVFVVDIVDQMPSEASGTPRELPKTLPELTYDTDGYPKRFKAHGAEPEKVRKPVVAVAIKGDGPTVRPEQNITVQYLGQIYPDGKVFDRSWGRSPTSFQIGEGALVPCWDDGLVGQSVGSRMILVCPPKSGKGKSSSRAAVTASDTLIFAIDILAAHDPPSSK